MKTYLKTILLAVMIITAFSFSALAGKSGGSTKKNKSSKINTATMAEFKRVFTDAENTTWVTTKDNFTEFSFIEKGTPMHAYYDLNGNMIASGKTVKLENLPPKAIRSITKYYPSPDYVVTGCVQMTLDELGTNYYVSVENLKSITVLQIDNSGYVSFFNRINK
jgi:hypothetical protein